MIGKRFGRLTVIERDGHDKTKKNTKWLCSCECGNTKSVARPNLVGCHTRSCGCIVSPTTDDYLKSQEKRFFQKVDKTSSCWIWMGSTDKQGYGAFNDRGRRIKAHRYSFYRFKEQISPGQVICHTCDTPSCVNPDHLYLGSHKSNSNDRRDRNRWGSTRKPLSEKQKEACEILSKNGFSIHEISEVLKISYGGVRRYASN